MLNFKLERDHTGLLIIDVQEKLFPYVERSCEVLHAIMQVVEGFKIFKLPIFLTEQYPAGLGPTVAKLKNVLPPQQPTCEKTAFSAALAPAFLQFGETHQINQWILVGIEAHVCVLQTAKDLLLDGKQVVVLNDAISSRSIYNFSTAIAEMRDCGARISSVETILFELLDNSQAPEFKQISQLVK
ncbi:MAG: isochorismatase [Parachlamydia sp.]|nr:MAG: isochorismatase [Parachlamydia sp.]